MSGAGRVAKAAGYVAAARLTLLVARPLGKRRAKALARPLVTRAWGHMLARELDQVGLKATREDWT